MEKHHKIHWKTGLDITPEVFIASDNYHIAERNLLGHCLACNLFGVLSGGNFYLEKKADYDTISVKNLACLAISRFGYVINISNNNPFNGELDVSDAEDNEHYVVLTVNHYNAASSDYADNYVAPKYDLTLMKLGDIIEDGIPNLKIFRDDSYWGIDKDYIPPSISLNSTDELVQCYNRIKNEINLIVDKLPEDYLFYPQTLMLQLELDSYSLQEPPQDFVILLKKFCRIFQMFLKTSKNIEDLPDLISFMKEKYNHLEIGKLLRLGINSLMLVNQKIDEKPVDELVEIKI